jgi:hypothetical protein
MMRQLVDVVIRGSRLQNGFHTLQNKQTYRVMVCVRTGDLVLNASRVLGPFHTVQRSREVLDLAAGAERYETRMCE